jgi:hypothetical protein
MAKLREETELEKAQAVVCWETKKKKEKKGRGRQKNRNKREKNREQ